MKTKNPQFKGSPVAAANFRWSLDFFRNHDVTTVGYNLIPDEVLEAWVAPDPQQLISDMADGKAEPDSTLPFAVYVCAYGHHDKMYALKLKDDSYGTPYEKVVEDFFLFQEALYYIVEMNKKRFYFLSFPILHFKALPEILSQLREAVQRLGVCSYKAELSGS